MNDLVKNKKLRGKKPFTFSKEIKISNIKKKFILCGLWLNRKYSLQIFYSYYIYVSLNQWCESVYLKKPDSLPYNLFLCVTGMGS